MREPENLPEIYRLSGSATRKSSNQGLSLSLMKELRLHGMAGAFQMAIESGNTVHYTIDAERNDRNERKRVWLTRTTGGLGKSYVGSALGHHSCDPGVPGYISEHRAVKGSLKEGKGDGSYLKLLEKIYKSDVLILDEKARLGLLDTLEDRHGLHIGYHTSLSCRWRLARTYWRLNPRPMPSWMYCVRGHRIELEGES